MEKINPLSLYNPYITSAQAINVNQNTDQKQAKATEMNPFIQQAVNPVANPSVSFGGQPIKPTSVAPENAKQNYLNGLAPGNQANMQLTDSQGNQYTVGKELYTFI